MTSKKQYDLIGIGAAIVDIISEQDHAFLKTRHLTPGSMTLVDHATSDKVYTELGQVTECAGGSTANTAAAYAMLGGSSALIGQVSQDALGKVFVRSLEEVGTAFVGKESSDGDPTGRCLVVVTEHTNSAGKTSLERTMMTYLGASTQLVNTSINPELIASARAIFVEGYSWDSKHMRDAVLFACEIARQERTHIAFSLSDPFCVERHHEAFHDFIRTYRPILFANEHEMDALIEEHHEENNLAFLRDYCEAAIITRSKKGSIIIAGDKRYDIAAERVQNIHDVTGAGDVYASGVLYGILHNMSYEQAGQLGSKCAAEVIQTLGARPASDLSKLIKSQAA